MNATKLGNIVEAIGGAYEDLRVDYDPPAMYLIAGIAATGDASHDDVLGAVMQAHRHLDPLVQCRLTDRITARLSEPINRSAPQRRPAAEPSHSRRPAGAEMLYGAAGRVLSVSGRPVR